MIDPGLSNRVVLVTGGNNPHGIGAATAKAFASQGAAVFVHFYRMPTPQFAKVAEPGTPAGPSVEFYYSMQRRTAEEVVRSIRAAGGRAEAWGAGARSRGRPGEQRGHGGVRHFTAGEILA
jgi:NAD(P)-dependent dehydrogenase (short-subunit alcohol dehydrogenase family)